LQSGPLGLADFDEQLWPVNLLLFVFSACVAGIIVAKSDFHTPRLVANGWCQLGALGVIVAALAWGIVRLEGRVQHRMQLGVFLSLLLHLGLCMVSYNLHLSALAQREKDAPEVVEEPQRVTLPDYNWQNEAMDDATDPTLDRPVETSTPDKEVEIERTKPVEEPKERPAEREPEARPQPSITPIDRAESSAPRREELAGPTISRQEHRQAETHEQVALPQIAVGQTTDHPSLESAVRLERAETRPSADRAESEMDLPANGPSTPSLARRANDEPAPAASSIELVRQRTESAPENRIRAESERVAEASDSPPRLAPHAAKVQRTETGLTLARRNRSVTEAQSVTVEPSPRRTERGSLAHQPRVDSRADTRLAKSVAQSDTSAGRIGAPQPQSPSPSQSQPGQLAETRVASVERARASLPDGSSMAVNTPREIAERGSANMVAAPIEATGRMASDAPQIASAASTGVSRRAAAAASEAAAEPVAAVSAAAAAQPTSQPSARPSVAALSKAAGGASGLTRQQSFDNELPGASADALARSAARRAEATQAIDAGAAVAPSDVVRVARSRAGAEIPTASMPAENVATADAAGSQRPAETEASASAAVERAAASAPRGPVTAAAGSGMIDQGVPQIRSPIGEGRTSGGGEPSLSAGSLQAKIVKATGAASATAVDGRISTNNVVSESGTGQQPSGVVPRSDAVGREASALPERSVAAGSAAEGSLAQAVAGEFAGRRFESSPEVAGQPGAVGQLAGVGRPRAALDALDGRAETAGMSPATGEGAVNEPGDPEPASASDLERQSPAGMLARGGDLAATDPVQSLASAVGGGSPRRAGEELAIAIDSGNGGSPAKSAGLATIGDAPAVGDTDSTGSAASSRGTNVARPSDLAVVSARAADPSGGRPAAALPVLAAAPLGAGGLSNEPAFDVGVPSRLARPESEVAHVSSGRLILERSGANRAAEVRVQDVAVPGFRQRDRQLREELARQRGGSEGSEQAVEMGLDFLARHQNVDGSWSLQRFSQGRPGYENAGEGRMVSDTAATGLAMLAFLGAGYTHTDGKYRLVVGRGLNYLLGNQRPDGDLFLPQEAKSNLNVWLYSHGIASIALCEAYGMTRDPNLRQPAQRALDFIVAAQHPTDGGWRYSPRQGSDTSVSGWQLMALKSGELAGLQVPAASYGKVTHWLDGAQAKSNRAHYVYRPKSVREHQRTASRVMTAEALLMRQYLGWKRSNPLMNAGADYLLQNLPEWANEAGRQRDSYYWYYATQVMFQMGGSHWDAWNNQLCPLLVQKQATEGPLAGSWEPMGDVPDRWGREGGRIYVTAIHLLMLEVYYRHLPLYRTLEGE
jgi:hypothetical protein